MNTRHNRNGIGLALAIFGALLLTPDTLFMRLSELDGFSMLVWRGGLSGTAYLLIWMWVSLRVERKIPNIFTVSFGTIILCQMLNATLFSLAIAVAPVAVVLIGVATVPVFAAVLSRIILGESLSTLTIVTAVLVMIGLYISVLGQEGSEIILDKTTLQGAILGLGVAFSLAMNFTIIRKDKDVPFVLAIALGAFMAAALGAMCADALYRPPLGNMAAIALTGIIILPVSFVTLSYAARFVSSSTVSLIMLLETVLGPLWIWWGIGEVPTNSMLIGGGIVVICLTGFLIQESQRIDVPPTL
jgi:drug/metabolite transporter (DMT)-like permease